MNPDKIAFGIPRAVILVPEYLAYPEKQRQRL